MIDLLAQSPEVGELAKALSNATAEIKNVVRDTKGQVGNQKYLYADLATIVEEIHRVFPKHGLSCPQFIVGDGNKVGVATLLLHQSGQWLRGVYFAAAKDPNPQTVGSVITYLRRYCLAATAGLAQEDDDGSAAQAPQPIPARHPPADRPAPIPRNEKEYWPSKQEHKNWLAGELTKRKIDRSLWDDISRRLDGRLRTDLDGVLLEGNGAGVPF